jgi:hypothetical protein
MTSSTGSTSNWKTAKAEVRYWRSAGTSVSTTAKPPNSPTRTTNWWITRLSGICQTAKTCSTRFCAAS